MDGLLYGLAIESVSQQVRVRLDSRRRESVRPYVCLHYLQIFKCTLIAVIISKSKSAEIEKAGPNDPAL